jgi:RNA polymerase sigma-70 factor (ECF subfamily)
MPSGDEAVAVREGDPSLERALDRLPVEQREVVALKLEGRLTFEEIGAALAISPNTAASRYRYALERLRDALGGRS